MSHPYIKVGLISRQRGKEAKIEAASIYVTENYLKHIETKHSTELQKLNMTAFEFVKLVCNNYNQIREGSGSSILLVVYNEALPLVAAIDINYVLEEHFWEVKTAEPRRCSAVIKKALIWEAAKHTSNGNGTRTN